MFIFLRFLWRRFRSHSCTNNGISYKQCQFNSQQNYMFSSVNYLFKNFYSYGSLLSVIVRQRPGDASVEILIYDFMTPVARAPDRLKHGSTEGIMTQYAVGHGWLSGPWWKCRSWICSYDVEQVSQTYVLHCIIQLETVIGITFSWSTRLSI